MLLVFVIIGGSLLLIASIFLLCGLVKAPLDAFYDDGGDDEYPHVDGNGDEYDEEYVLVGAVMVPIRHYKDGQDPIL